MRKFAKPRCAVAKPSTHWCWNSAGVDLTAYLTQDRADRVIELRGGAGDAHVHLDCITSDGDGQS